MDQQSTRIQDTVNVDGFWMLLALLDIRHVAPGARVGLRTLSTIGSKPKEGLRASLTGNTHMAEI
jgi:hypothetical protein